MKVRIAVGLGAAALDAGTFPAVVGALGSSQPSCWAPGRRVGVTGAMFPRGAGIAEGAAVALARPDDRASEPERLVDEADADRVAATSSVGDAVGVASSVVGADCAPGPSLSSVPTLVPLWLLLSTGPPVKNSMPVTSSMPTAKISTAAPAKNGHRARRGRTAGAIDPVG